MGEPAATIALIAVPETTAMILLIIGTAASFSWLMAFLKVPAALRTASV